MILGNNGAGKSTLLNIISMLIPKSFGDIKMFKQDQTHMDLKTFGRRIGICW